MKYLSLFSLLLLGACDNGAPTATSEAASVAPANAAKIELFVMSQCPYGVQVEDALIPVKEKLGDSLEISIDFIGGGEAGSLTSMHGPNEVAGNLAQVCAAQQMPDAGFDFIACQNKDARSVHTNWKACGAELGLDMEAFTACFEGPDGQELLAASYAAAQGKGATGSPTIYLNGEAYRGGRKSNDLLKAVCRTWEADAPAACADIPVPPTVAAIFLSDTRCPACDLHGLEPRLKGELGGLQVKYVDYSSPEGQALYAEQKAINADFGMLPTVLLDPAVEKDADGYAALKRYLRPAGAYVELAVGGKFDPTAEICDNGVDDDNNGASDCDDSGCAATMGCREKIVGKVDLFVMSQCPYGAKALIATNDVLASFGDDIDLDVHFIGQGDANSLSSMHGPKEVELDIYERCAEEKYPKASQFMAFNTCISRNYKTVDWKTCADEAGMQSSVLQACYDGEGRELLAASFREAQALGIGSSPTFLVNNTRTFNAITAPDLQRQICQDNPSFSGCSDVVVEDASAEAPPAACE